MTWYLCLLPRKVEKIQYTLLSEKKNIDKGQSIFYEEVGGWWNSPPPPPPQTVIYFGVTPPPPFKRYIIIIKPQMHIFCSVQYDLYFLFNVKLLTTHSTDVAATSVNSKNIFCPFAKALLHYFSNIKKYRESKERKVSFRSSVYGSSRACRCWPLNFFLVINKGKDDIFTSRVDGIIVVLSIITAFTSAVLIFIAVTVL